MIKSIIKLNKKELINFKTFASKDSINHYNNINWISLPEKRIFNSLFLPGKKCLDLGCGIGRTTIILHEKGLKVIGIDIVPEMIHKAKQKFKNLDFRVGDASDLSQFNDNSFDYVLFSFNGIDYIFPEKKRIRCLNEIYRVLKKGGIFAFSSYNSWALPISENLIKNKIFNLFKFRLFSKYKWAFSYYGKTFAYHTNYIKQKYQLKNSGFKKINLLGRNRKGGFIATLLFDNAPYYISKK